MIIIAASQLDTKYIRYLHLSSFIATSKDNYHDLHRYMNVREYRRGIHKRLIQRNWQHRIHTTKKNKTKTQHDICQTQTSTVLRPAKIIMLLSRLTFRQFPTSATNLRNGQSYFWCNDLPVATSGAGTSYQSGSPEFTPRFQWCYCYSIFSFMCMSCRSLFFPF